jgi:hypothetical protein
VETIQKLRRNDRQKVNKTKNKLSENKLREKERQGKWKKRGTERSKQTEC